MKQKILILGLIILAGVFVGKNIIIKKTLESNLTKTLESKVKIKKVSYNILKNNLSVKNISIENKQEDSIDAIKIGEIKTDINFKKIFEKEITLETLEVKDIEIIPSENEVGIEKVKREEEIKSLASSIIKNYKLMYEKINLKDREKTKKIREIFLGITTPFLDKYIDYKLSDYGSNYIEDLLKKYTTIKSNLRSDIETQDSDKWIVNIKNVKIETTLYGRYFLGTLNEISTDMNKMNKFVEATLIAKNKDENSKVNLKINPYKLEGEIRTSLGGVNIETVPKFNEYLSGKLYLEQEIFLIPGSKVFVNGKLKINEIKLKEDKIGEYFLEDKEAIKIISGGTNENLQDFNISYKYSPTTNGVEVDSNLAEKITIYLGGDANYFESLKNNFKYKYEKEMERAKEKINNIFNKILK